MENTPTVEVVTKATIDEERAAKLAQLNDLHAQLTSLITARTEELAKKVYIIEGKVPAATNILNFLNNDAQWKFTEAMGVIEATKEVEKSIDALNKGKVNEIYLNPLAIEATYYFLTKTEGKGLNEAAAFYDTLLKPVSDALSRSKADRQELDQMQMDLATLEQAIETGASVEDSLVKEITAELTKQSK